MSKQYNEALAKGGKTDQTNPKDLAAETRVPLQLLPALTSIHGAMACRDGAIKYGPYNWREKPITMMHYLGALERHIARLKDGHDVDEKSGVTHLGHIIATCGILLDAHSLGMLIDDRPGRGMAADQLISIEDHLLAQAILDKQGDDDAEPE